MATTIRTQTGQNCPFAPLVSQITVQTTNRAAGLLEQATGEVPAALGVCDGGVGSPGWEVRPQRLELAPGASRVRGVGALLELFGAEPAGGEVLAELGDDALAVLVGRSKARACGRLRLILAHSAKL